MEATDRPAPVTGEDLENLVDDMEKRVESEREEGGAEVIALATRNVLPAVTQRKRADGLGLVAGIAIVAALGGLTL
ncbi:MAG: hypothetical protein LOY04_05035, partial [Rhodococcus ruber]|nr:hypothetical protein [Rhodococcus ruber]